MTEDKDPLREAKARFVARHGRSPYNTPPWPNGAEPKRAAPNGQTEESAEQHRQRMLAEASAYAGGKMPPAAGDDDENDDLNQAKRRINGGRGPGGVRRAPIGPEAPPPPDPPPKEEWSALRKELSFSAWMAREIPARQQLLGELLTTTTRVFLSGFMGTGKTMFGIAIAFGIATAEGFLHWQTEKPARVLYLDGEMPAELIKERIGEEFERVVAARAEREHMPIQAADALREELRALVEKNLVIYSTVDLAEGFAERHLHLGLFASLNSEKGHAWVGRLLAGIGKVDLVIFDNVATLTEGVQKEEETWLGTLPLMFWLTRNRIGQLWFDHTGWNQSRQYGTTAKGRQFDASGVIEVVPEAQREEHEVAFTLSFEAPGKARRRTPKNWEDFEKVKVSLLNDKWSFTRAAKLKQAAADVTEEMMKSLVEGVKLGFTNLGDGTVLPWSNQCDNKEERSIRRLFRTVGVREEMEKEVLRRLQKEWGMEIDKFKDKYRKWHWGCRIGEFAAVAWKTKAAPGPL